MEILFIFVLLYKNKTMRIQETKSTNQTTFKWNSVTHIGMTLKAVSNSTIEPHERKVLAKFVLMPDFLASEQGYHNNTHFFFPYGKTKSFGRGGDAENNALERYKEHLQMALTVYDKPKFLKHAGFAIHYLQDVSMPMHTEPGGLLQKIMKYKIHKDFEIGKKYGATPALKDLLAGYAPENIEYSSLIDLFVRTAEFSQRPEFKIKSSNKSDWFNIQQQCFNRGVDATREFFNKLLRVAQF